MHSEPRCGGETRKNLKGGLTERVLIQKFWLEREEPIREGALTSFYSKSKCYDDNFFAGEPNGTKNSAV